MDAERFLPDADFFPFGGRFTPVPPSGSKYTDRQRPRPSHQIPIKEQLRAIPRHGIGYVFWRLSLPASGWVASNNSPPAGQVTFQLFWPTGSRAAATGFYCG